MPFIKVIVSPAPRICSIMLQLGIHQRSNALLGFMDIGCLYGESFDSIMAPGIF
jgi:hypothetical protein